MARDLWNGYGPPADAPQWRGVAEWLECESLHGSLFDDLPDGDLSRWALIDAVTDAIMNAADDIEAGHTREACCYDRQRHNRRAQEKLESRQGAS